LTIISSDLSVRHSLKLTRPLPNTKVFDKTGHKKKLKRKNAFACILATSPIKVSAPKVWPNAGASGQQQQLKLKGYLDGEKGTRIPGVLHLSETNVRNVQGGQPVILGLTKVFTTSLKYWAVSILVSFSNW